jgi:hypothetical protein
MFGGTLLVRMKAGADAESRWWLLPGERPDHAPSPSARDEEGEEDLEDEEGDDEDDEDDEDDDEEDEEDEEDDGEPA